MVFTFIYVKYNHYPTKNFDTYFSQREKMIHFLYWFGVYDRYK